MLLLPKELLHVIARSGATKQSPTALGKPCSHAGDCFASLAMTTPNSHCDEFLSNNTQEGDYQQAEETFSPDDQLLVFLNIRFILAKQPLPSHKGMFFDFPHQRRSLSCRRSVSYQLLLFYSLNYDIPPERPYYPSGDYFRDRNKHEIVQSC